MITMSPVINELAAALAKAQGEMKCAAKTDKGNWGKYASFPKVIEASRPFLSKHGLSVAQPIGSSADGDYITTILLHSSGQYMSAVFFLKPLKPGRDQLGSEVTYWKRQCYKSIIGVVDAEESDYDNAPLINDIQIATLNKIISEFADKTSITNWLLDGYAIDDIKRLPQGYFNEAQELLLGEFEKEISVKKIKS